MGSGGRKRVGRERRPRCHAPGGPRAVGREREDYTDYTRREGKKETRHGESRETQRGETARAHKESHRSDAIRLSVCVRGEGMVHTECDYSRMHRDRTKLPGNYVPNEGWEPADNLLHLSWTLRQSISGVPLQRPTAGLGLGTLRICPRQENLQGRMGEGVGSSFRPAAPPPWRHHHSWGWRGLSAAAHAPA